MSSPKVKKQHYVPQFYLRLYAESQDRLYVFDKHTERSFRANVRDIASTSYFYDFHPDIENAFQEQVRQGKLDNVDPQILEHAQDPQLVEHALAEFEQAVAPVLDQAVASIRATGTITGEQKEVIAEFLAMQLLRTPEFRSLFIELAETVWNEILERDFNLAANNLKVEFDEKQASLMHADLLFAPALRPHIAQVLARHIWLIGVNDTDQPLYTSDQPVVKMPHLADAGVGSPGIELAFPLTSRYVLILCERTAFAHLAGSDRTAIILTPDNVTHYNGMQVTQSTRQVFCIADKFALAEEILADHPELTHPTSRPRIQVASLGWQLRATQEKKKQPADFNANAHARTGERMRALTHRQRKRLQSGKRRNTPGDTSLGVQF